MNKLHPSDIIISQNKYTVFELHNMIKEGSIYFEEDTTKLNFEQKSIIIENILLGITMIPLYIYHTNTGQINVFIGQNILKTISGFIDNDFELTNLEFFSDFNGCRINTLPSSLYRKLHEAQFTVYVISPSVKQQVRDSIIRRICACNCC